MFWWNTIASDFTPLTIVLQLFLFVVSMIPGTIVGGILAVGIVAITGDKRMIWFSIPLSVMMGGIFFFVALNLMRH